MAGPGGAGVSDMGVGVLGGRDGRVAGEEVLGGDGYEGACG